MKMSVSNQTRCSSGSSVTRIVRPSSLCLWRGRAAAGRPASQRCWWMSLSLGVFNSSARQADGSVLGRKTLFPLRNSAGCNALESCNVEAKASTGLFFDTGGVSVFGAKLLVQASIQAMHSLFHFTNIVFGPFIGTWLMRFNTVVFNLGRRALATPLSMLKKKHRQTGEPSAVTEKCARSSTVLPEAIQTCWKATHCTREME